MGDFLQNLQTIFLGLRTKLFAGATDLNILYQLVVVVVVLLAIFLVSGWLRRIMARVLGNIFPGEKHHLPQIRSKLVDVAAPLAAALVLSITSLVAQDAHWGHQIIYAAGDLLWAWVIIRFLTGLLISPAWSKPFAVLIMAVAAMDIVGVLDPTITVLDRTGFNVGEGRLSLWVIIKTGVMLALLLPLSGWLSHVLQHRVEQIANLSPRVQVLLVKLGKTALYTLAIVIALRSVGFDFHLLAVFSGAVGLGVGFGLQKVVSNLVSGVIILMDNSIRPGDVIEVGGVFGWIESLHSRFISMITRDGTSYLIPNDELITNKVINWSFSGRGIRLKIPVGISYTSNVHEAMALMVAAAGEFPRILANPKPVARLISFGDSAIDLDLRIWIKDPEKGVTNIKSEVQLKIWDLFKEHGIEFPFPQHDLHIKTPTELTVRVKDEPA
ncbi:MAG: mechanosensitive ion channel family protein [Thermodesulfobacteriota bacterium]